MGMTLRRYTQGCNVKQAQRSKSQQFYVSSSSKVKADTFKFQCLEKVQAEYNSEAEAWIIFTVLWQKNHITK